MRASSLSGEMAGFCLPGVVGVSFGVGRRSDTSAVGSGAWPMVSSWSPCPSCVVGGWDASANACS
eukprot:13118278-Alexandrium_andersonii.AAC.1